MFRKNQHKQVRQNFGVNGKAIQPTLLPFDELLITDGVRHSDISLYLHQQTLSDVDWMVVSRDPLIHWRWKPSVTNEVAHQ